jgi:hypothetical protein
MTVSTAPASPTAPTAPAATLGTFGPLNVKNAPAAIIQNAATGIRARVVALIVSAGNAGASIAELIPAWPGNGSPRKVRECMNILRRDYGYPVERASHAVDKDGDRYRFTPGAALTMTAAPDATAPAPAVTTATPPVSNDPPTDADADSVPSKPARKRKATK